jgi:two-component system response regulator NreC
MGGTSTLQSIPDLISHGGGVRIIVLTMHEDPGFAREALRLGARGYVLKDAAADELLLAVRNVQRGSTYLHPSLGARLATLDERPGGLTEREVEVLRLITAGHTNAEIGQRMFVSLRTVESHRGQIRAKLNLGTRAELSTWALEHGISPGPERASLTAPHSYNRSPRCSLIRATYRRSITPEAGASPARPSAPPSQRSGLPPPAAVPC